jgi:hypothetical protein
MALWGIEATNTCNVCQLVFFFGGGLLFMKWKKENFDGL